MNILDSRTFDADQMAMTYAMTAVCLVLWVMYWVRGKRLKRLEKQLKYSKVRVVTDFENGRPVHSDSKPVAVLVDIMYEAAKTYSGMRPLDDKEYQACCGRLRAAVKAYEITYHGEDGTLPLPFVCPKCKGTGTLGYDAGGWLPCVCAPIEVRPRGAGEDFTSTRILAEDFKAALESPPQTRITDQDDKR